MLQRLLVQTYYSDDCTYSATVTEAVMHESPESFVVAMEEAVLAKHKQWTLYHAEESKLRDRVMQELRSLKESTSKHPSKNHEAWMEHQTKPATLEFKLGGVTFDASDYLESTMSDQLQFKAPDVYTLDEFFKSVELETTAS